MNIPGILKIEKIAYDDVEELPMLKSNQSLLLDDYISGTLEEIEIIGETSGIKVINKTTGAGPVFDIEIPFTIAGYDDTILDALNLMHRKPHIFVVTEKSGLKYLIGLNRDPKAKFDYELKSDPDGSGGRSTSCKITWSTTVFPVYVTDDAGGGGLPT